MVRMMHWASRAQAVDRRVKVAAVYSGAAYQLVRINHHAIAEVRIHRLNVRAEAVPKLPENNAGHSLLQHHTTRSTGRCRDVACSRQSARNSSVRRSGVFKAQIGSSLAHGHLGVIRRSGAARYCRTRSSSSR